MRRTKAEALETREALLDAAERIFFANGVARTSLTEIAAGAGLTRGAIYWHFADKAALFEAMLERGRLPQEHVAKLLAEASLRDPLTVIHEVAVDGLRYLASDERSQRVCTIMLLRCEFVGEMSDVLVRMRMADKVLAEAVTSAFREAEKRGHLRADWSAETAGHAHLATMTGLITQWLRSDRCFDLLRVGEPMMGALTRSFRRIGAADERPTQATAA